MATYVKHPLRTDMETIPNCTFSSRVIPDNERYEISVHEARVTHVPVQIRLEKSEARVLADAIYTAYGFEKEGDGEPVIGTMASTLLSTLEVQAKYSTKIDAWLPIERFVAEDGDDGEAVLSAKARAFDVLAERYQGANGKTPVAVRVVGVELYASFDSRMHGGN